MALKSLEELANTAAASGDPFWCVVLKEDIKERLNKDYEKLSQEIVVTTTEILKNIKGIYINKYEIENFMESIEKYITYLTKYVEISYNKA